MLALLYLAIFLLVGIAIARSVLNYLNIIVRIWIGLSLGFLLLMILPASFAFAFRFSIKSHIFAIIVAIVLMLISLAIGKNKTYKKLEKEELYDFYKMIIIAIPFCIIMGFLQYTHIIRPALDGSFHVGQSTFGDLPLHLSIITGAVDSAFPLHYSIYPKATLSYPFLIDTLSSTFYMLGLSLQASIIIPSSIICSLIFFGYMIFAKSISKEKNAFLLAFLFLFLNGGLGFIYMFDKSAQSLGSVFNEILNGFYKTPTNMPVPHNLRWSNVLVDMLLPQRTYMGAWLIAMPSLYLLNIGLINNRKISNAEVFLLVLFVGFAPMVNTHAFLALGIFSIVSMVLRLIYLKEGFESIKQYIIFGAISLAISLPQLYYWTFAQSLNSSHFLKLHFNWVNNPNDGGLIDLYFWFYLKNIGLIFIAILLSFLNKNKAQKTILISAFAIFAVAEFIRFQPNEYDNNKLFYIWFLICLPIASDYLVRVYKSLKHIEGRKIIASLFLFISFFSASLSIAREINSDYQIFEKTQVSASEFIKNNTEKDALFISSTSHRNVISALSGRNIICGPDLWLYFHGFNTGEEKSLLHDFYANPRENHHLIIDRGAKYIYLSSYERHEFDVDEEKLDNTFKKIYENDEVKIYTIK